MADTTVLTLPLISASQAQKHVTHNEALVELDIIVQAAVLDRVTSTPPGSPTLGDRYIIGASATGVWAGREDQIALYDGAGWVYASPLIGWRVYIIAEDALATWVGAAWVAPPKFNVLTENASYATVDEDFRGNRLVEMDVASANTFTVSPGMVFHEPLEVAQRGAGQTTITAGAGVTLLAAGGALKLRVQNSVCKIAEVAPDTYRVWGDLVT